MALAPDVRESYAKIIDSILASSDLSRVSTKQIRKGIQASVDYDVTPQKDAIKELIEERFDIFATSIDSLVSQRQIEHHEGSAIENWEIESVINDLLGVTRTLRDSIWRDPLLASRLPKDEQALNDFHLVADCKGTAEEIIECVNGLKCVPRDRRSAERWESFPKALMMVWGQKKIDEIVSRLDSYRSKIAVLVSSTVNTEPQAAEWYVIIASQPGTGYGSYRKAVLPFARRSEHSAVPESSRHRIERSFDWSGTGRGSHIDLEPDEEVPLQMGRFLGRGATGDVYEATCQGLIVALKRKYSRSRASQVFGKELEILDGLGEHDHIVKIAGSFIQSQIMVILLLPVAVCDLQTFLEDVDPLWRTYLWNGSSGFVQEDVLLRSHDTESIERLRTLQVLEFREPGQCTFFPAYLRLERSIGCIASALSYLHERRIKHKDLKPSNILLTATNILLTDFGTSTDFSEMTTSVTDGGERGTPKYFAPEVEEYLPSGRPADIFSLGCIYLEICYVYYGTPLSKLRELRPRPNSSFQANLGNLPRWIQPFRHVIIVGGGFLDLLCDMMRLEPESRPPASEVVSRLRNIRQNLNDRGEFGDVFVGECCTDYD